LAEDLESGGFSIGMSAMGASGPNVPVKDTESADIVLQWFHRRPRPLGSLDAMVASHCAEMMPLPTIKIETTRARMIVTMVAVVSETRQSSDGPWKKEVWTTRKEDVAFHKWAAERLTATLEPAMRGLLERGEISDEFDWEQMNSLLRNDNGNPEAPNPELHHPVDQAEQEQNVTQSPVSAHR